MVHASFTNKRLPNKQRTLNKNKVQVSSDGRRGCTVEFTALGLRAGGAPFMWVGQLNFHGTLALNITE